MALADRLACSQRAALRADSPESLDKEVADDLNLPWKREVTSSTIASRSDMRRPSRQYEPGAFLQQASAVDHAAMLRCEPNLPAKIELQGGDGLVLHYWESENAISWEVESNTSAGSISTSDSQLSSWQDSPSELASPQLPPMVPPASPGSRPLLADDSDSSEGMVAPEYEFQLVHPAAPTMFLMDKSDVVIVNSLPEACTEQILTQELKDAGFKKGADYDCLIVPCTPCGASIGCGIINFTSPSIARAFAAAFQGRPFRSLVTECVMQTSRTSWVDLATLLGMSMERPSEPTMERTSL